jgi:hypothetical protein
MVGSIPQRIMDLYNRRFASVVVSVCIFVIKVSMVLIHCILVSCRFMAFLGDYLADLRMPTLTLYIFSALNVKTCH